MEKTIVLGVGNILMQDEGFGVRVVEEISRRYTFPKNVQALDGGTLGMELLNFIKGAEYLLIIDAVNGGGQPGDLYQLTGEEVKAYFKQKVSMHEIGIQDVLTALELLEQPVKKVVVVGVQPAVIDIGLELTEVVQARMDDIVKLVVGVLDSWGINCQTHT
ncbi:HyaD/HybD family hydrogenase maturation endopeptidase [Sporomusa acidovorans]|uniref:Hydrogenase 2 maturation protease n=1 Tax=Sporomusa acidovorans (strain ATCC 49682 / DSM 3132 / Mol) TaxID=1123286 RepID=A0ABZ3J0W4_SPOA4|nr:HyaD/HybD family hydrogenase maturation endopeptidase [Sporomusa acidovorans]OZC15001.1 hydrogenase 2 maturation protease [Sporomusa acidovorans DSM 3132]SDE83739.1 hydrogenase maturation protease [Sporomusa acidovorans]